MWGGIWGLLQESEAALTVFHDPANKALTPPSHPGAQKAGSLAWVQTLETDPSVDAADWAHGKSSHQQAGEMTHCSGCQIVLEIQ